MVILEEVPLNLCSEVGLPRRTQVLNKLYAKIRALLVYPRVGGEAKDCKSQELGLLEGPVKILRRADVSSGMSHLAASYSPRLIDVKSSCFGIPRL